MKPYAFYVSEVLRTDARVLFGSLLKLLCRRAGITQQKLESDSKDYRKDLIQFGFLRHDEETGSMNQSVISLVMKGLQPPTYAQTCIWLDVIDRVYKSEKYREICREIGWPYANFFSKDLKTDMYRLASFGTPEEIVEAYERRKSLLLQDSKLPPIALRANPEVEAKTSGIMRLNHRPLASHAQEHA